MKRKRQYLIFLFNLVWDDKFIHMVSDAGLTNYYETMHLVGDMDKKEIDDAIDTTEQLFWSNGIKFDSFEICMKYK